MKTKNDRWVRKCAPGIVHRDLKPENVMVVENPQPALRASLSLEGKGEEVRVKLMDFGLARTFDSHLTAEGMIVGTVSYLAPAQALGQAIDGRTDLYALGVMLYELLTGVIPFSGPTPIEIMRQHLSAPLPPLAANRAGLPKAWDDIIAQATAKDPSARYASVESMLSDVRAVNDGTGMVAGTLRPKSTDRPLTSEDNPYKGLRV